MLQVRLALLAVITPSQAAALIDQARRYRCQQPHGWATIIKNFRGLRISRMAFINLELSIGGKWRGGSAVILPGLKR